MLCRMPIGCAPLRMPKKKNASSRSSVPAARPPNRMALAGERGVNPRIIVPGRARHTCRKRSQEPITDVMSEGKPLDCYELLQVNPNAELDTIHRVYRLLAQRFHPDNKETGNDARFRELHEA